MVKICLDFFGVLFVCSFSTLFIVKRSGKGIVVVKIVVVKL